MVRVINTVDKAVKNVPMLPVTLVTNTSTKLLASIRSVRGEGAARYIQNIGANDLYLNYDGTCDATNNFVVKIAAGLQQDVSNFPGDVFGFSVGGTSVCFEVLTRDDLTTWQQYATGNMNIP